MSIVKWSLAAWIQTGLIRFFIIGPINSLREGFHRSHFLGQRQRAAFFGDLFKFCEPSAPRLVVPILAPVYLQSSRLLIIQFADTLDLHVLHCPFPDAALRLSLHPMTRHRPLKGSVLRLPSPLAWRHVGGMGITFGRHVPHVHGGKPVKKLLELILNLGGHLPFTLEQPKRSSRPISKHRGGGQVSSSDGHVN